MNAKLGRLIAFIFPFLFFASCMKAQNNAQFTDTNVAGFAKLIENENVQLLDVRTPAEYAEGHIAGALNIDYFDRGFLQEAMDSLDKERPVAVYCRSGRRSADAAEKLSREGYKVTNLLGGIMAWENAGMPTVE